MLKKQKTAIQPGLYKSLAYASKPIGSEKTSDDNLYLGIALVVAIVVTGLFSYWQRRKTTKIMQKFENLIPQSATCIRNGEKVID